MAPLVSGYWMLVSWEVSRKPPGRRAHCRNITLTSDDDAHGQLAQLITHLTQCKAAAAGRGWYLLRVSQSQQRLLVCVYSRRPTGLFLMERCSSRPAKPPGFSCGVCTVVFRAS